MISSDSTQMLSDELRPKVDQLMTEDDTPVDNVSAEKLSTGCERTEAEKQRAQRLAEQLRRHGIAPEA